MCVVLHGLHVLKELISECVASHRATSAWDATEAVSGAFVFQEVILTSLLTLPALLTQ